MQKITKEQLEEIKLIIKNTHLRIDANFIYIDEFTNDIIKQFKNIIPNIKELLNFNIHGATLILSPKNKIGDDILLQFKKEGII